MLLVGFGFISFPSIFRASQHYGSPIVHLSTDPIHPDQEKLWIHRFRNAEALFQCLLSLILKSRF